MYPVCESLSSLWPDENTDKIGWTCIQYVSCSPVFDQIRPLTRLGEHASSMWVTLQCLTISEPLMRTGEHASSEWVALQCLSESSKTLRLGENAFSLWATLQCLTRSEPLMRTNGWTCIQYVSCSSVFEQNYWRNRWTLNQSVSFSSVFEDQNHWQEWVNIHLLGCESLSSVWVNQNHWQKWMNTHPACELLSNESLWLPVDWNHWWECINAHPGCESLSSVTVFDWIRTTDKNMWTYIQDVSHSQCLTVSEPLTRMALNGRTCIQLVSGSPVFEHIRIAD